MKFNSFCVLSINSKFYRYLNVECKQWMWNIANRFI